MFLAPVLFLVTIPSPAGEATADPRPSLDLRVGGFPLQGQPLSLEVRGPADTAFAVRLDFLSALPGADHADGPLASEAIAGTRAASDLTRLRIPQAFGHRLFAGRTNDGGSWRSTLEAPLAGTEILVRGFTRAEGRVQEFEALELDVLAPYAARPGDVSILAGDFGIELEARTEFALDLAGWTLSDDRGDVETFPEGTRLPARGAMLVSRDAFPSLRGSTELVLTDGTNQRIGRTSSDSGVAGTSSTNDSTLAQGPSGIHSIHPHPCDPSFKDLPDLDFEDANCDGIDGDVARAVFVATTGSPSNPGTMDQPVNDVNAAIAIAAADPAKDQVYVSEGTYPGLVTMVDGVSVWGGYSAAHGWQRSNGYVTTFSVGGVVSGNRVGVLGSGLSQPVTLGNVTVLTDEAPARGGNYGVLLRNSASVRLEAVTIVAGAGGTSSPGTYGAAGWDGGHGTDGLPGGYGGPGGDAPPGGTAGGHGGDGGGILGGGQNGANGGGSNHGGGGRGGASGENGARGGHGGTGADGASGQAGSNVGTIVGGFWSSNGNGGRGGPGLAGGGGGGGGGAGGTLFHFGGGGGGGGGGAQGGDGGSGGTAGGSSFALFLSASHVAIQSCELKSGIGRAGGQGGLGGWRGFGGAFGHGQSIGGSLGGDGGAGGNSGYGGGGGGGGGGHSYALLIDPLSSVDLLQSTTLSTSAPGAGGNGGGAGGSTNAGQHGHPGEAAAIKTL